MTRRWRKCNKHDCTRYTQLEWFKIKHLVISGRTCDVLLLPNFDSLAAVLQEAPEVAAAGREDHAVGGDLGVGHRDGHVLGVLYVMGEGGVELGGVEPEGVGGLGGHDDDGGQKAYFWSAVTECRIRV